MNFPRFFHKKKDTSHIGIILDLGSQYIKSTLIEKKADQICMLGQGKIMHQIGDMEKGGIVHLDHVYKNCILAIEEAKKHSKNNPSQLILAVDGISIHSINTQTEYNRSDSYSQISESEIKNLIHKSQWKAFEQAKKYIKEESNNNEVNIKLLSSSMGDVSIDGFRIQDPVGFTGKNIKISFLNSFCPETFLTGYKQLAKKLELDLLSIVPSFQGVAQGLIEDQGNSSSGILIDIGSHHTQITLIQKWVVARSKAFELGGQIFTKRIAKIFDIHMNKVPYIMEHHLEWTLSPEDTSKINTAFEIDCEVLLTGIEITLRSFEEEILPHKIYIYGWGSVIPQIQKQIKKANWHKTLPFNKNIDLARIGNIHSAQYFVGQELCILGEQLMGQKSKKQDLFERFIRLFQE